MVQGKYEGKILTLTEAAKYLRMGVSTLYAKSNKGIIPCFPQSQGKKLFNVDVLDAWLEGENQAAIEGEKAEGRKEALCKDKKNAKQAGVLATNLDPANYQIQKINGRKL